MKKNLLNMPLGALFLLLLLHSPLQGQQNAVTIVGNVNRGALLFADNCRYCHDAGGIGPSLSPINRTIFSTDVNAFLLNIDMIIQHGRTVMPAFGDRNLLTQEQIADIEAYLLDINGIKR